MVRELVAVTTYPLARIAPNRIVFRPGFGLQSSNYASGLSGWLIEESGAAEFENVVVRGAIRTSVLQYGVIQAVGGSSLWAKSAGKARADFTSVDSPGTFTVDIEDPPGLSHAAAGGLWAVNDVVRIKDGPNDLWAVVTAVTDMTTFWRLTLQKQSPGAGTNYTFTAGAAVVNYGQAGQGLVSVSADGTIGAGPNITIATNPGTPWTGVNGVVRFGNLKGWGAAFTADEYGWAVGNPASTNYAYYTPAKGLVIAGTVTANAASVIPGLQDAPDNLIANGNFEGDPVGSFPSGWTYQQGVQPVVANDAARVGLHSYKLDHSAAASDSNSYTSIPSITAGNIYELTAWVKTTTLSGTGRGAKVGIVSPSGSDISILEYSGAQRIDDSGSGWYQWGFWITTAMSPVDWTLVRVVFKANTTPAWITLNLGLGWGAVQGTAWFDGVVVRRISSTIGGWTIGAGQLTAGSVTISAGIPAILMGSATSYGSGTGIFLGNDAGTYKFRVGDPAGNRVTWDGSTVNVVGTITANAGQIGGWNIGAGQLTAGSVTISASIPAILMGSATSYGSGVGIFLGNDAGTYKFRVGDPAGQRLAWDGTSVLVKGTINADAGYLGSLTVTGLLTVGASSPVIYIDGTNKYIRSSNYASGSAGFTLNPDGTAELNSVTVRGTIYANAGSLGNLNISGTLTVQSGGKLVAGSVQLDSNGLSVQASTDKTAIGNAVRWYYGSTLVADMLGAYIPAGTDAFQELILRARQFTDPNKYVYLELVRTSSGSPFITLAASENSPQLFMTTTNLSLRYKVQWGLDVGLSTYPTPDDLLLFASNRTLFCVGRVNVWLAGNAYWDGSNWNLFDTNSNGITAAVVSDSGFFGVWSVPAGTNPRPLNLRAVLANQANPVSQHILYNQFGGAATDWPAGWNGGLATADISCANIYYNALVQRSDPRLKENAAELADRAVEKVRQLKPVRFRFKEHGYRERRGLLATDVHAVLPEICEFDEEGNPVGYDLSELVAYLVKAVKELSEDLESLKRRR